MTNEEAIDHLSVVAERMNDKGRMIYVGDVALEAVDMAIEALQERKTGKWELAEMGDFNLFACSECGYRTINRWWKACPNCDAKMEVDE